MIKKKIEAPKKGKTNEERRAESVRKILAAIPGCGQRIEILARNANVSERICRKIVYGSEYKYIRELFEAEPYLDPYEEDREEKAAMIEKNIPLAQGKYEELRKLTGYAVSTLRGILNDKRHPQLKKLWRDEQEKNGWSLSVRGISLEDSVKYAIENNKPYDPDFEIDSKKECFLPHQIEFAYLAPDVVKHPAMIGGFGSGKTMSIPLRWLKLIEFRKAQGKNCDIMVLEPTNEMLRDIIVPTFDEFFERFGIPVKFLSEKKNYSIYYKGEKHTCLLRSADRPRSLTGKNLSDIIIDEFDRIPYYKQKQVWRECISRIRKTEFGTCAVVTTPDGYKMTYELWGRG